MTSQDDTPVSRPHLSAAMEDYLKEIFHLSESGRPVQTAALAARLGVAAPSVTNMVKRLDEMHLVVHSPYRGIELTAAGRTLAVEVIRHHRLIELYLAQFLGMPWDRVHEEAERLEHVISEDLESRIAEKLGEPAFDPHGDPIPSRDGTVPWRALRRLDELEEGESGRVARITLQEQEVLQYLASLEVQPGAVVRVESVAPFGGVVTIRVHGDGASSRLPGGAHALGETLARHVLVASGRGEGGGS